MISEMAQRTQRRAMKEKTNLDIGKGKDGKKEFIYNVAMPHASRKYFCYLDREESSR